MTLYDMFKQYSMNPDFCQKKCALNRDAYLNGCVLKQEIIVQDNPVERAWLAQFIFLLTIVVTFPR